MQLDRRAFLRLSAGAAAAATLGRFAFAQEAKKMRLNFLLITADDMGYNSPGFAGCKVKDITPNLDKLAAQSLWFKNAHVAAAICMPSRQAMMTGRYPHNNGAPGFDPIDRAVPTLQESLHAAGYLNGILGKVLHQQPLDKFPWDFKHDAPELGMGRSPELYHKFVTEFLAKAKAEGKPFFLMANSHDPHRPFAGSEHEKQMEAASLIPKARKKAAADDGEAVVAGPIKYPPAHRYYTPEEVTVPGFLPDVPDVRKEMAQYFTSVHRCDETIGEILRALKESGMEDNTVVMFLSDNGMSVPFAKTNCYLASSKTPWLVRWPGKTKAGTIDTENFICGVDFMPTILDAAGIKSDSMGMDGRSFVPLLSGGKQDGRDNVFTVINTTSAKKAYPMRAVQNKKFGYIFNSWSDGQTIFKNEPQAGLTWKAMTQAAQTDPAVKQRTDLFSLRVKEELYDLEHDPDALKNLAGDPAFKADLLKMRQALVEKMTATKDPLLETFHQMIR